MKKGKTAVIVGAQWGDEGKGKIVDVLSENFSVVARYAGGHNAGRRVVPFHRRDAFCWTLSSVMLAASPCCVPVAAA